VRERKRELGWATRSTCVPQSYGPGQEGQVDWYEAWAELYGEQVLLQVFSMRSMASRLRRSVVSDCNIFCPAQSVTYAMICPIKYVLVGLEVQIKNLRSPDLPSKPWFALGHMKRKMKSNRGFTASAFSIQNCDQLRRNQALDLPCHWRSQRGIAMKLDQFPVF